MHTLKENLNAAGKYIDEISSLIPQITVPETINLRPEPNLTYCRTVWNEEAISLSSRNSQIESMIQLDIKSHRLDKQQNTTYFTVQFPNEQDSKEYSYSALKKIAPQSLIDYMISLLQNPTQDG